MQSYLQVRWAGQLSRRERRNRRQALEATYLFRRDTEPNAVAAVGQRAVSSARAAARRRLRVSAGGVEVLGRCRVYCAVAIRRMESASGVTGFECVVWLNRQRME
jgi:hypothetical protein